MRERTKRVVTMISYEEYITRYEEELTQQYKRLYPNNQISLDEHMLDEWTAYADWNAEILR